MGGLVIDTYPWPVFCVGDSMTHDWPLDLASLLTDRIVTGQGIGGSQSHAHVQVTDGLFISYPQGSEITPAVWFPNDDTITPGVVTIQLQRHTAKQTFFGSDIETYRALWVERVQQVATPTKVEVFNNGEKIGEAVHNTFEVTTDYATDINRLYKIAHGLNDGDFVAFWVDDANRPARSSGNYYHSSDRPSNLTEYKMYEVVNATADSFEIIETDLAGTPLDLGSNTSGTLICETGWSLNWDYPGGDWDLSIRCHTDVSDRRIMVCQTTTNDVIAGDPGDDYQRWSTHTLPAIEYLYETNRSAPRRFVYVSPTLSHSSVYGGPGGDNWVWQNEVVRPWANGRAAADSNFLFVDVYELCNADGVRLDEELALLVDPEVAELLWIRGDPETPASWEAFSTDQGDTFERWVGPDFLPLHFRNGGSSNNFLDSGHYNDGDGAAFVAQAIYNAITNKNW